MLTRKFLVTAVLTLTAVLGVLIAQENRYTVEDFASTITPQDIQLYLSVLASDALEGRETGTPANDEAARFIAAQLQGFGIPPVSEEDGYFQPVTFSRTDWQEVRLRVDEQEYRHLWDFLCIKNLRALRDTVRGEEVVFLGYGIDDPAYSDYVTDVRGKAILIYEGEPVDNKGRYRISGTKSPSEWGTNWMKKIAVAREHGVTSVFVIARDFQKLAAQIRRFSVGPNLGLGAPPAPEWPGVGVLSADVARTMMGEQYEEVIKSRDAVNKKRKTLKPVTLPVDFELIARRRDEVVTGYNVLGFIEGSDPDKKHELVVLTAHFDHLGKRGDKIFYGADDNGSGTSAVMDIAKAFSMAKSRGMGPARSVLALFVTGEEKGLLGSKYYVEHPVFPLEHTIANVNIDMIGRVDAKYKGNPDYIYVIGSDKLSTDLHLITEDMNKRYTGLTLDYTYNDENDPNRYYYRSDHYNFVEKGIPAVFFFSGVHEDYHRPTDTIDKIDFERTAKVAKLAFHIAWELANRDERIQADVAP